MLTLPLIQLSVIRLACFTDRPLCNADVRDLGGSSGSKPDKNRDRFWDHFYKKILPLPTIIKW